MSDTVGDVDSVRAVAEKARSLLLDELAQWGSHASDMLEEHTRHIRELESRRTPTEVRKT